MPQTSAARRASKNAWQKKNYEKVLAYNREWARNNRDKTRVYEATWRRKNLEKARAADNKKAAQRREILREAKDRPCADCGQQYPFYVMDFDHVRGEKSFDIGRLVCGRSMDAVIDEILKCDVVCSNCHRERTYQRRQAQKAAT